MPQPWAAKFLRQVSLSSTSLPDTFFPRLSSEALPFSDLGKFSSSQALTSSRKLSILGLLSVIFYLSVEISGFLHLTDQMGKIS